MQENNPSPISLEPSAVLPLKYLRVPTKPDIVSPKTPQHGFPPVRNLGTWPLPAHAGGRGNVKRGVV